MNTSNEVVAINELGNENSIDLGNVGKFKVTVTFSGDSSNRNTVEEIQNFMRKLVLSQMEEKYGK